MGQFCATESERCGRCVVVECDSACAARPSTDVLLASLRAAVERLGGSAEERRLALLVLEKLDAEQLRAAYAVIIEKKPGRHRLARDTWTMDSENQANAHQGGRGFKGDVRIHSVVNI